MAGYKTADQEEKEEGCADETQVFQEEGIDEDEEKRQVDALFVCIGGPEPDHFLSRFPCLDQDEDGEYSQDQAGHQGKEP